jgi:hypothetical protein
MYPLNMTNPAAGGFAVANDEAEHQALTGAGYGPAFIAPEVAPEVAADDADTADPAESDSQGHTVESVRAQLDAAGIAYDRRLGLQKLLNLIPA